MLAICLTMKTTSSATAMTLLSLKRPLYWSVDGPPCHRSSTHAMPFRSRLSWWPVSATLDAKPSSSWNCVHGFPLHQRRPFCQNRQSAKTGKTAKTVLSSFSRSSDFHKKPASGQRSVEHFEKSKKERIWRLRKKDGESKFVRKKIVKERQRKKVCERKIVK